MEPPAMAREPRNRPLPLRRRGAHLRVYRILHVTISFVIFSLLRFKQIARTLVQNHSSDIDLHLLQQQQLHLTALSALEGGTCHPLRDVSNYSLPSTVQRPKNNNFSSRGKNHSKYDSCLQFKCNWNTNHAHCDSFGPTIYNDPSNPPCCVHILRDMAAAFDAVMCKLGFEYFSSYGMLLGLVRNDKLIPWTSDNDYIATARTLAALHDMSPKDKKVWDDHGIHFFFDEYFHRVCVTPTFMSGELANLWTTFSYDWYPLVYPYADIFIAWETSVDNNNNTGSVMIDQLKCAHRMENIRPAQRRGVYNNSFQVSMPNNAEEVLERLYGSTWRKPDAKKTPHGGTRC